MIFRKIASLFLIIGLLSSSIAQSDQIKIMRKLIPDIWLLGAPFAAIGGTWLAWDGIKKLKIEWDNYDLYVRDKDKRRIEKTQDAAASIFYGTLFSAVGSVSTFLLYRWYTLRNKPLLILDDQGITVEKKGLLPRGELDSTYQWSDIKKIQTCDIYKYNVKIDRKYIFYTEDGTSFEIRQSELNLTAEERNSFEKRLKTENIKKKVQRTLNNATNRYIEQQTDARSSQGN